VGNGSSSGGVKINSVADAMKDIPSLVNVSAVSMMGTSAMYLAKYEGSPIAIMIKATKPTEMHVQVKSAKQQLSDAVLDEIVNGWR